jgi:hypothetical protein
MRLAILGCALIVYVFAARAQEPFVTIDGDAKSTAWWVLADFHPSTAEVHGIPASKIRKSWCKATEFRKDLLPREFALNEDGTDALEGYSFELEGSFDGSATKQVALVGVYEECSGKRGRFFMVLDLPAAGAPRIRLLDAHLMAHQFGALKLEEDNTITVMSCMDCDDYAMLRWDRKRRKFVWSYPSYE